MARISKIVNTRIELGHVDSWLDIGTGDGAVVSQLKWNSARTKIAVDSHKSSQLKLDESWDFKIDLAEIYASKQMFDLVTLFDVIEHFPKSEGKALIQMLKARTQSIIVFTPRGFLQQDETTHPMLLKDNPGQRHVCGWTEIELAAEAFEWTIFKRFHNPQGVTGRHDALLGVWRH